MAEKINIKCYKCGKVLTITYPGRPVIKKCSGCGRMIRIDGTGEGKPAYVLSPKSRIGAKS